MVKVLGQIGDGGEDVPVEGLGQKYLLSGELERLPADTEEGLHQAGRAEDLQRADGRELGGSQNSEKVRIFLGVVKSVPRVDKRLHLKRDKSNQT